MDDASSTDWHAAAVEHLGHCPCDAVRVHGPNSVDWALGFDSGGGTEDALLLLRPSTESLFAALEDLVRRFPGMNRDVMTAGRAPDGDGLWAVLRRPEGWAP